MSIAGPPAQRWPQFFHAPGFAESARNGPKSRKSPVSVIKIPPLRGLERDRAGSLPVHGTVSAGPETNRLPSSKIPCASPAFPARPGQPTHFSHDMAACFVAIIGSWENRLKPPHGVAGSLRSYAPPSWEKHCSIAPVSHRQPLGKSTFRPPPSAIGSLLGKPAAERPRRPGSPATNGTRSAVFGPSPRPGQPARGAPGRCRGDDIDDQAQKVHLLAAVPPQAGSRRAGPVQAEIEAIAGSRVQYTAAPWP